MWCAPADIMRSGVRETGGEERGLHSEAAVYDLGADTAQVA